MLEGFHCCLGPIKFGSNALAIRDCTINPADLVLLPVLKPCWPLLVMSTLYSFSRFLILSSIKCSKIFEAAQGFETGL